MVHRKAMFKPEIKPELRKRLQIVKDSMMGRCYNKNNPKYKNYGARGVTVDSKWHRVKGFLDDYDKIDGWDEEKFLNRELQLDKDTKFKGNKLYSKDTCRWVTPEENNKVKPSYQKTYVGVRADGYKEVFTNAVDFFSKHNIKKSNGVVREVAEGKRPYYDEWYFYFEGAEPKPPIVYKAEKNEETIHSFKQRTIEKYINPHTPTGTIYKMKHGKRKNNVYEGWRISWYSLPC